GCGGAWHRPPDALRACLRALSPGRLSGSRGPARHGKKRPGLPGLSCPAAARSCPRQLYWRLREPEVGGGRGLLHIDHDVAHLLRFLQRAEALRADVGVMGEEILPAVVRRDESEALRVVEPLHGTCSHCSLPFSIGEAKPAPRAGTTIKEGNGTAERKPLRAA